MPSSKSGSKSSGSYLELVNKLEEELYKFIKERVSKKINNREISLTADMFCRKYPHPFGSYDECKNKISKELASDPAMFEVMNRAKELVIDVWLRRRIRRFVERIINSMGVIEEQAINDVISRVIEYVLEPKYAHDTMFL